MCQKCSFELDFCTQQEASIYYPDVPLVAVCRFDKKSRKIIHTFKYQGIPDFGEKIAELMYLHIPLPQVDFITSVPPDPRRKKQRGFDHTQLIAKQLARKMNTHYISLLKKNYQSDAQAKQASKKQRLENATGRVSLRDDVLDTQQFKNKHVLLIDDVCTTGSTLRECMQHLSALSTTCTCAVFCIRI